MHGSDSQAVINAWHAHFVLPPLPVGPQQMLLYLTSARLHGAVGSLPPPVVERAESAVLRRVHVQ